MEAQQIQRAMDEIMRGADDLSAEDLGAQQEHRALMQRKSAIESRIHVLEKQVVDLQVEVHKTDGVAEYVMTKAAEARAVRKEKAKEVQAKEAASKSPEAPTAEAVPAGATVPTIIEQPPRKTANGSAKPQAAAS